MRGSRIQRNIIEQVNKEKSREFNIGNQKLFIGKKQFELNGNRGADEICGSDWGCDYWLIKLVKRKCGQLG